MKNRPLKGDWSNTVIQDMEMIGLTLGEQAISETSISVFKTLVKSKMRQHVLNELNNIKMGHSEVNCIMHSDLKSPQKYLTSSILTNEQKNLLFNLRCKSQNEFFK